jgi:4,5-DOPA dioxygenase extradiol
MPALFLGHGSPMNAVTDSVYSERWEQLGASLPRPKAIVCVSAHWFTGGTGVTAMERPPTIHDFYGFPPELHAKEYPCPGDPQLAGRVAELLAPLPVVQTEEWGLDHGAWSLLARMYPEADIPVIQLSMDGTMEPRFHFESGRRLAPLRDEGILVLASGNVCHAGRGATGEIGEDGLYTWAASFHTRLTDTIRSGDYEAVIDYETWTGGKQAAPTPEHFLPLLYLLGIARPDDIVTFPVEGLERHGAMSMLGVQAG